MNETPTFFDPTFLLLIGFFCADLFLNDPASEQSEKKHMKIGCRY
ncbi:MAG: hypothetical protein Ct9H300mP20_06930 [Gammaproteobacteria bacterium]|nr:MAG: hypothetical protein Ct9H300mP20_06930 [Gammaproteobacteria bacterium]